MNVRCVKYLKPAFQISLLALLCAAPLGHAELFSIKGTIFEQVAAENHLDPLLLYAIAFKASSKNQGKGLASPSPYALRSTHVKKHFQSQANALLALSKLLKQTSRIDVGMMQINLFYHPHEDPLSLLDPKTNLEVAAKILQVAINSDPDPIIGVGRYFTWATKNESRKHGKQVWTIYSNLKKIIHEQQEAQS